MITLTLTPKWYDYHENPCQMDGELGILTETTAGDIVVTQKFTCVAETWAEARKGLYEQVRKFLNIPKEETMELNEKGEIVMPPLKVPDKSYTEPVFQEK